MADSFADLARKLDNVANKLAREDLKQRLERLGEVGSAVANESLAGDTSGAVLRNWRRGRPIKLTARGKVNVRAATVEIGPTPKGQGPWKVLTYGRQAGRARSGRPVSASRGKGTWTHAVEQMPDRVVEAADRSIQDVLRSQFGG